MFALLALAGDIGCSLGPSIVGFVAEGSQGNMQRGILVAMVLPVLMLLGLILTRKKK